LYAFFGGKASMDNGVLKTIWPAVKPVALDQFLTGAHTEGFKLYICSTEFMHEQYLQT
jgi:hypothetical protein